MSVAVTGHIGDLPSVAESLIKLIGDRKIIAFHGNLGAGKTTLVQAMCRQLGVTDEVSSPTFSIVNEYTAASGSLIYHFDCYRLKTPEEAYDIGIEEYLHSGHICFIEWPENLGDILPPEAVDIIITSENSENRTYTVQLH